MNNLKGLSSAARVLLTEEFRKNLIPAVDASEYVVELGFGRTISLSPLEEVITEVRKRFEYEPWKSDSWLGPRVHAALRLTRREASDPRVWQYLTAVAFPDYVRWRWKQEDEDDPVPIDRFFGKDSKSSFARLWWAAELTRNGSDYTRTAIALGMSYFPVEWQRLNLVHHRAATLAAVDFLYSFGPGGATGAQGQRMARVVNVALRTVCLDALADSPATDAEAVREWIAETVDETTMMDELPVGPDEAPVPEAEIAAVREFLDHLAERIELADVKAKKRERPAPVAAKE